MKLSLLLFCLLLIGCGRKTEPMPYGVGDEVAIKPLLEAKAHFRQGQLRLAAQWPEKVTPGPLLLEIFVSQATCPRCTERPQLSLILKDNQAPKMIENELDFSALEVTSHLSPEIEVIFAEGAFGNAPNEGRLHLQLSPLNSFGDKGPATALLTPKTPGIIPNPKVTVTASPCEEKNCPPNLTLKWEGASSVADNLVFISNGLGLVLYQIKEGKEIWFAGPLHSGNYQTPAPKGALWARNLDAWGNESAAVLLYEMAESQ